MTNNLEDLVDRSQLEKFTVEQKFSIASSITGTRTKNDLSIRDLSSRSLLHHPQIVRITNSENYTIDSLLKVLYALNLEIKILPSEDR